MSANFNYNSLSPAMSSNLQEIARMAWGSGCFEGKSGGAGRMGLIYDNNNNPRVIKFNTKSIERSFGQSVKSNMEMLNSSDRLRNMLKDITDSAFSKGLPEETKNEIYAKLGFDASGKLQERTGNETGKDLLSRKVVAQVVSKLGGDQIWKDAWFGRDKASYSTSGNKNTQFKDVWTDDTQDASVLNSTIRTMDKMLGTDLSRDVLGSLGRFSAFGDQNVKAGAGFLLGRQNVVMRIFNKGGFRGLGEADFERAVRIFSGALPKPGEVMDGAQLEKIFEEALQSARAQSSKGASRFGIDEIQLQRAGLSFADLETAVGDMAKNFGLNQSQKQSVVKMTMAYLASKLGDPVLCTTVPDKQTLLEQIGNGTFEGTYIGLLRLGITKLPKPEGVQVSEKEISPYNDLYSTDAHVGCHESVDAKVIGRLNEESCEKLVFLLGKLPPARKMMEWNFNGKVDGQDCRIKDMYTGIGCFLLASLVKKQDELIEKLAGTGRLDFKDIYRAVLGENPEKRGGDPLLNLIGIDKIKRALPEFKKYGADTDPSEISFEIDRFLGSYQIGIAEFGLEPSQLQEFRKTPGTVLKFPENTTFAYKFESDYNKSRAGHEEKIAADLERSHDKMIVKIGNETVVIPYLYNPQGQEAGKEEKLAVKALIDQLVGKLGAYIKTNNPTAVIDDKDNAQISHQFGVALLLLYQGAFEQISALTGAAGSYSSEAATADREFFFDNRGTLHCILSQNIHPNGDKNLPKQTYKAHYEIDKDGTNRLVSFSSEPLPLAWDMEKARDKMNQYVFGEFNSNVSKENLTTDAALGRDWYGAPGAEKKRDPAMNNLSNEEFETVQGDLDKLDTIRNHGTFLFLGGKPVTWDPALTNAENVGKNFNDFLEDKPNVGNDANMKQALRYVMTGGALNWPFSMIVDHGFEGGKPVIDLGKALKSVDIRPSADGGFDVVMQGTCHNVQGIKDGTGQASTYLDPNRDNKVTYSVTYHLAKNKDTGKPEFTVKQPMCLKTDFQRMKKGDYETAMKRRMADILNGDIPGIFQGDPASQAELTNLCNLANAISDKRAFVETVWRSVPGDFSNHTDAQIVAQLANAARSHVIRNAVLPNVANLSDILGTQLSKDDVITIGTIVDQGAGNGCCKCTLCKNGQPLDAKVVIGNDGSVMSSERYDDLFKKALDVIGPDGKALLSKVSPMDLDFVKGLLTDLVGEIDKFTDAPMSPFGCKDYKGALLSMLVTVLPRAHKRMGNKSLTLERIWSDLRLDGSGRKKTIEQLPLALQWRFLEDFRTFHPEFTKEDVKALTWNDDDRGASLADVPVSLRQPFSAFLSGYMDKVVYEGWLNAGVQINGADDGKENGAVMEKVYSLKGVFPNYSLPHVPELDVSREGSETLDDAFKRKSAVQFRTRTDGSKWTCDGKVFVTAGKNVSNVANDKSMFYDVLRGKGFTKEQIYRLSLLPNNTTFSVLGSLGYAQSQQNMRIFVEKNGFDMKVTYEANCRSPKLSDAEDLEQGPTKRRLRYEVSIDKNGGTTFLGMKIVDNRVYTGDMA